MKNKIENLEYLKLKEEQLQLLMMLAINKNKLQIKIIKKRFRENIDKMLFIINEQ